MTSFAPKVLNINWRTLSTEIPETNGGTAADLEKRDYLHAVNLFLIENLTKVACKHFPKEINEPLKTILLEFWLFESFNFFRGGTFGEYVKRENGSEISRMLRYCVNISAINMAFISNKESIRKAHGLPELNWENFFQKVEEEIGAPGT